MKMGKGVLNKIVIVGLVIIALSFTAGLASSGFNFAEAAGGWKPAVDALLGQITGLGDRTSELEGEVFCSGNGTYDSGTGTCACDTGFSGDDCSETVSVCGNGIVESGEACDDGNTDDGDGCSADCILESDPCEGVVCNDGNVCTGDSCDPNTGQCTFVVQPGNACDDGEACSVNDVCDGAGLCVGTPLVCDDGVACTQDTCVAGMCTVTVDDSFCNDGQFCTGLEVCDILNGCISSGDPCDGVDGDADCSETCDETANACTGNDPISVCSLGFCDGDGTCIASVCGNGIVELFEQCDDGNSSNTDDCSNSCLFTSGGSG